MFFDLAIIPQTLTSSRLPIAYVDTENEKDKIKENDVLQGCARFLPVEVIGEGAFHIPLPHHNSGEGITYLVQQTTPSIPQ